jgi:hypothetical protein
VEDGAKMRIKGEGDAGQRGGPSGDLYIFVSVEPDKNFKRDGLDLYTDLHVNYLGKISIIIIIIIISSSSSSIIIILFIPGVPLTLIGLLPQMLSWARA